ncbi:MAG TPA: hypothetical protein VIL37_01930 [Natronosporangium sp.]
MTVLRRDGGWSRRAVLGIAGAVAAVGVLPGCSWLDREEPPPPPDPLEPLLAGTRRLAARYDAAIAAFPELTTRLQPLRETHRAHETALLQVIGRPELASPSPGNWSAPAGGATPAAAVAALREAELAGQADATEACLVAPADRAPLLGSIVAARACHAEVLTDD